jgi:hypothetical protein
VALPPLCSCAGPGRRVKLYAGGQSVCVRDHGQEWGQEELALETLDSNLGRSKLNVSPLSLHSGLLPAPPGLIMSGHASSLSWVPHPAEYMGRLAKRFRVLTFISLFPLPGNSCAFLGES